MEDLMCSVETQLVEKHTFLQLEPQHAADDCCLPQLGLKRSRTDTLVDYSVPEKDLEATSTDVGSRNSSLTSSKSLTIDRDEEKYAEEEEEKEEEEEDNASSLSSQTSLAQSDEDDMVQGRQQSALGETGNAYPAESMRRHSSPRPEQLYYYFPLPGSPLWGLGASMAPGKVLTNPVAAYASSPSAGEHSLALAHAAEMMSVAVKLEETAEKFEVAAKCSSAPVSKALCETSSGTQYSEAEAAKGQSSAWQNSANSTEQSSFTTLMLRNIPNDYTRAMVLELLDSKGMAGKYDFVYLPIDFNRRAGLGYAFVNLVSHADAELARSCLHGFNQWEIQSPKICQVCWGEPLQGLEAHVERYRSSPVMHKDIPDEFKPIVLQAGVRVPFPPPTKRVRPPRSKYGNFGEDAA